MKLLENIMLAQKNLTVLLTFIALLLVGVLSWQLLRNYFNGSVENSVAEFQPTKQPAEKEHGENSQKSISHPATSNTQLPLVLSTKSISDQINKERIAQARETYEKGSNREKIQALHLLMQVSPADASAILRDLLSAQDKTEESLRFIRHLMSGLSEEKAYLQDADIKSIYALNDPVGQKIAAIILADRGDDSLTKKYLKSKELDLKSKDYKDRSNALKEIGSVGFSAANNYFVNALEDPEASIKIQAIEHLMVNGDHTNISSIEKLLQDNNPSVVEQAQKAINALRNNSADDDRPLSRRLMQPGFPVNGLVPDSQRQ